MRTLVALGFLVVLSGCPGTGAYTGPPSGQLYYPTGIVHVDRPGNPHGVLLVANANFDKRFATGSVVGFDLNRISGLPPFGAYDPDAGPPQLTALGIGADAVVQVSSFAGEMAAIETRDGGVRLYVPTRSEGNQLHAIDVAIGADDQPTLTCVLPPDADPEASLTDCAATAPSLTEFEFEPGGIPRAPAPFGVAVRARSCLNVSDCGAGRSCDNGVCRDAKGDAFGDVWVTHLTQADSPLASGKDARGYAVHLETDKLDVPSAGYFNIGPGSTSSVAIGKRYSYFSGRYNSTAGAANLVRLVERTGVVWSTGLEYSYRVAEARGLALSSDEKRLYLVGRAPDTLVVINIDDSSPLGPSLKVVRAVPLPEGSNELRVIPRPGRSDLVAVTCSGGGVVVLYDDDVGDLVAQVQGVGLQTFGLAVAMRPPGARLFATNFSDGRVAIIDIPDLNRPQEARIAAHLGVQQLCLTRGQNTPGCSGTGVAQ
jgi:hypothetical protein